MEEDLLGIPMIGEKILCFTIQTPHGKMIFPKDMKESWWVLFQRY